MSRRPSERRRTSDRRPRQSSEARPRRRARRPRKPQGSGGGIVVAVVLLALAAAGLGGVLLLAQQEAPTKEPRTAEGPGKAPGPKLPDMSAPAAAGRPEPPSPATPIAAAGSREPDTIDLDRPLDELGIPNRAFSFEGLVLGLSTESQRAKARSALAAKWIDDNTRGKVVSAEGMRRGSALMEKWAAQVVDALARLSVLCETCRFPAEVWAEVAPRVSSTAKVEVGADGRMASAEIRKQFNLFGKLRDKVLTAQSDPNHKPATPEQVEEQMRRVDRVIEEMQRGER